jgi:hypothetical protein
VRFGNVSHDREARPGSALASTAGAVHAIETVEHALQRIDGYTRTVVLDNQSRVARLGFDGYMDCQSQQGAGDR